MSMIHGDLHGLQTPRPSVNTGLNCRQLRADLLKLFENLLQQVVVHDNLLLRFTTSHLFTKPCEMPVPAYCSCVFFKHGFFSSFGNSGIVSRACSTKMCTASLKRHFSASPRLRMASIAATQRQFSKDDSTRHPLVFIKRSHSRLSIAPRLPVANATLVA